LSKIRAGSRLSGPLWIKESAASLRVLELVALHLPGLSGLQRFKRIYRKYRHFGRLSMDFFHFVQRALQHQI
jgi:hypothetical protein